MGYNDGSYEGLNEVVAVECIDGLLVGRRLGSGEGLNEGAIVGCNDGS